MRGAVGVHSTREPRGHPAQRSPPTTQGLGSRPCSAPAHHPLSPHMLVCVGGLTLAPMSYFDVHKWGSNLGHPREDGKTKRGTSIQWNVTQPEKGVKLCHRLRHGWAPKIACKAQVASHKRPHIVIPLIQNIQNRQIHRRRVNWWVPRAVGRHRSGVTANGVRVYS